MGAITAIVSVVIDFLLESMVALPNGFLFIHIHRSNSPLTCVDSICAIE